ncbi:DinB family protein [Ulvibacter litoralis]|uniref:DinB superfamily protein n=1 Tax=Ulvibacter litoralis TaxID=227084 RepID=A0A1G7FCF0_9FLAO|nr:DinB family protein [Ulvibacter litoralis]GHC51899.1 DNA damage-inducible protein DinB [Ulvibacter litoralis]SDE73175.1 DinB superfamily protein [Ulvibacter litoralis]
MKSPQIPSNEYAPYFKRYIDLVSNVSLVEALRNGEQAIPAFYASIPDSKLHFKYAEGKWTPKEVLLHIIDTERVFCYRALYFARAENASLEGFDENVFGANCKANTRSIDDLIEEYKTVRAATISLFSSFNETTLLKGGKSNSNYSTVRSLGFIVCGHEIHHQNIINERYL